MWVGENRTLIGVDARTGNQTVVTPPLPGPRNPFADIDSLAVGPQDQVAIAFNDSPYIEIRWPSGRFTTDTLGSGMWAGDLAYLANGDLGVTTTVWQGHSGTSGMAVITPAGRRELVGVVGRGHHG